MTINLDQQIASVRREIGMRERVYPAWVKKGKMKPENASHEITDKMALAKAVVAGTVPLMALEVNTTFMGQQARSLKGELNYPGVRVFEEQGIASRSA
jgi:hypothetical protein